MRTLFLVFASALVWAAVATGAANDWSPERAAAYLDGRQQQWSQWPRAQSANGPCVSCHTGMTYLVARPALRGVLAEKAPTAHETALLDRLRRNVGAKPPAALRDVEVIFAALFLAMQDRNAPTLSADTQKAFDQLWSLQIAEGEESGTWKWYDATLDPWEMPESRFFGASLAAMAVGLAPAEYRQRAGVTANVDRLKQYLTAHMAKQPLHNRVTMLWASSALPEILPAPARQALIDEIFRAQQPDGSWTMTSLGPWQAHAAAPAGNATNYATAFTAYAVQQATRSVTDARMQRALQWLRARQDADGSWASDSVNKSYPDGSMERSFMRDAATAFAAAALSAR